MCSHVYRYVEQSEKGVRSSGAGVTSGSESSSMIVGNQTQVSGQEWLLLPTELPLQPLQWLREAALKSHLYHTSLDQKVEEGEEQKAGSEAEAHVWRTKTANTKREKPPDWSQSVMLWQATERRLRRLSPPRLPHDSEMPQQTQQNEKENLFSSVARQQLTCNSTQSRELVLSQLFPNKPKTHNKKVWWHQPNWYCNVETAKILHNTKGLGKASTMDWVQYSSSVQTKSELVTSWHILNKENSNREWENNEKRVWLWTLMLVCKVQIKKAQGKNAHATQIHSSKNTDFYKIYKQGSECSSTAEYPREGHVVAHIPEQWIN